MFIFRSVAPTVLKNNKITRKNAFIQFFAYAMVFNYYSAKKTVNWFDKCLEEWNIGQREYKWDKMSLSEKSIYMQLLFDEIMKDHIGSFGNSIPWLGFSSGLDSRFIFYALNKEEIIFNTFTYGQIGNHDYDLSCYLSKYMQLPTKYFDTSELSWKLELYDQVTHMLLDRTVSPRVLTAFSLSQQIGEYTEIHGFLNDHISGSVDLEMPSKSWETAKRVFCKANDQFGFQEYLNEKELHKLLPVKPFYSDISYDRQLDLGYRQYQRIRPTNYLNVTFSFPFADKRWVGFWLNRSHQELYKQSLYIDMLTSLDSEVFTDLNYLKKSGKLLTKKKRKEFIYGKKQLLRYNFTKKEGKIAPLSSGAHFCFFACYKNNKDFKKMINNSIKRVKKRNIFYDSFIDSVMVSFLKADKEAEKKIKGIVSIDICLEAGVFEKVSE